jgi:tight adherence protein C
MTLLLLLFIGLAGAAIALLARAAVLPRIRADENVGRIAAYGYSPGLVQQPRERTAVLPKLAARLGDVLSKGSTSKRQEDLRKTILAAGAWNTSPAAVLGYRALAATSLCGLALWTGTSAGWAGPLVVIAGVYGFATGWIGPLFLLRARAKRRTERIELELPELIDLLVVTLEAGIGFNAALQRTAERMTGPLGDEIRLTLHEHHLGLTMEAALANLLARCDVPSIRAFVRAVTQSERLGISIGQIMRDLAHDIRKRRRQIIEEKAQKAPIKMLFPLAFLVLPSLLLVILYPGLHTIVETLGNR